MEERTESAHDGCGVLAARGRGEEGMCCSIMRNLDIAYGVGSYNIS